MGIFDGFFGLGDNVNKFKDDALKERTEGILDRVPELSLDMDEEELVKLSKEWEKRWQKFFSTIKEKQEEGEKYWAGQHYNKVMYEEGKRPIQDNVIFEAVETFLPAVTRANPNPVVSADSTDEGDLIAKAVQKMLAYQADRMRLRLKVKKAVRFWALYLVGVAKISWSQMDDDISLHIIRPQKLIMDPDGTIDEDMSYTGEFMGEYKKDSAADLIVKFPNHKKEIEELVHEKMGTIIQYTEWWTNKIVFWKLDQTILGKMKNPHWNYDIEATDPMVDEQGKIISLGTPAQKGRNHFQHPEMPYICLSIFNLGKHPIDETSLILQNLSNQDLINKRNRQIDKNTDGVNGGWVISGEGSGLTKEQAAQAIGAFRKGKGVYIPSGSPANAVQRMMGTPLPNEVFEDRNDARQRLHDIFGIGGSTAAATRKDRLSAGKQMMQQQDISRYSGIIEYIEQFYDKIYNWEVQMMYVYYDEEHSGSIIGAERATEWVSLKNSALQKKLTVGVKEGSLIPKDPVSLAQQAEMLTQYGAIDPITLFDRLDFSNPKEAARKKWIWDHSPQSFFEGDPVVQKILEEASMTQKANEMKNAHSMDQAHQNELENIAAKGVIDHVTKQGQKETGIPKGKTMKVPNNNNQ